METKNIIQASANIIRITNLKKGDVYKRLDDSAYSDKIRYGVVVNLYNDGSKTFIEAIEYKVGYGDIDAERKVISGTADVSIFPATPDEVAEHFNSAIANIERKIVEKKEEVLKLQATLEHGREFVSGELAMQFTEPEHREQTQREFLSEQRDREIAALDQ